MRPDIPIKVSSFDEAVVETTGFVDLRKSLSQGAIPSNLCAADVMFDVDGELSPDRIGPKPQDQFDAMNLAKAGSAKRESAAEPSAAAAGAAGSPAASPAPAGGGAA